MPRYHKNNEKELKEFLCNSYVHDAKLENIKYDCRKDTIIFELFNPIHDAKINLTFLNIIFALKIKGDWSDNHETVISLSVEEDFSFLRDYPLKKHISITKELYLLFQMFSGDEFHIVSNEVIVEINE